MARLIIDRVLQMAVVLICVTLLGFLLVNMLKGNVIYALLGDNYTPRAAAELSHELHLDQPLVLRYLSWLGAALHGDLGVSVTTHEQVAGSITSALPATAELLIGAQLVGLLLAVATTALAVRLPWLDRAVTGLGLLSSSVPPFVLGLLMITLFSTTLHLLPAIGWADPAQAGLGANLQGMIMPSLALGVSVFPEYMRVFRGDVNDQLHREEYVTLARMKGISSARVLTRHVARNSVGGLITLVAITTGFLMSGVVIVEQVFGIPGIGSLVYQSITKRDSTTLEGVIVLIAVAVVVFNLIGELIQMALDPRVRPR